MKKIFSLKLANELVKMGNTILDTEINIKNPKLKVFMFKDDEKLRQDMTTINNKRG